MLVSRRVESPVKFQVKSCRSIGQGESRERKVNRETGEHIKNRRPALYAQRQAMLIYRLDNIGWEERTSNFC